MTEEAIRDLARAAGIANDWVDASGRPQRVAIESLRRMLAALDLPCGTPAALSESRARLDAARAQLAVPPLVTATVGARIGLAGNAVLRDAAAEIVFEDGTVRPTTVKLRRGKAMVPAIDRPGYHRLRFAEREVGLAIAPARCVALADIAGDEKLWGLSAQIYSLRRPGDGGIGDATSVRQLAEAAARQGADALALSPAHSLFAADAARYGPYSPSSRLFLNPLFCDPAGVLGEARVAACRAVAPTEEPERLPLIDWPTVATAKFALLRRLFEDFAARDLATGSALARDFERFAAEGGARLREHALFEALHGKWFAADQPKRNWAEWPAEWRDPAGAAVSAYVRDDGGALQYHVFLQWLTARSFDAAQKAARDAGMRIGLIADLAIGMDRGGSHAWARQGDLLLGLSVGAPPDAFNPRGQDWGLTGFSPQALVATGFEPFLATVRSAMRHAGGLRIDHIMGLMRLWLIPQGSAPSEGAYLAYPFDDLLRLLALESHRHRAVVIGEDLGTVPRGFRPRLRRVGIAGMDVLWFQRTQSTFLAPSRWRSDAVAMTTTHDLPTVAGWWSGADVKLRRALGLASPNEEEQRPHDRRRLWRTFGRAGVATGPAPLPDQTDAAVDAALAFVARAPAPLVLAPLEDMLGLKEQPNLPGTIDEHPNWRRRLEPAASELLDVPAAAARAQILAGHRK